MSNRILDLQQSKAAAIDNASAILKKLESEKRSAMTPEERTSFDGFTQEAEDIQATITREERMATLGNIHTDKNPKTPGAGATQVYDNVLDKPWGPEAKSGETKEERRSRLMVGYGEYLKSVQAGTLSRITNDPVDPRLMALNEGFQKRAAAAGSSEAVPTDGGFLIHPDFSAEILELAHETGLIYPRTRKLPLSEFTNAIKIPAIDEQSRKDGYRWGGVQMFWENEAQQLIGSKPTFALLELVTKKLTGLYYATNEVLADARLLGSVVMQAFGEEMGFKLDDGVIRGTGAGQLSGILNANALITVPTVAGQATKTVVIGNIRSMWSRLWNRSRPNAVWLINQDVEPQLNGLNSDGANTQFPIYLPPGAGVWGAVAGAPLAGTAANFGPSGMLYGRPVITVEQCNTLGTAGDIILADLSQYLMVDKGDLQTATSMHVRFLTDEQTFRYIYRTDGQLWWKVPVQPANGTNTLSPVIALTSR